MLNDCLHIGNGIGRQGSFIGCMEIGVLNKADDLSVQIHQHAGTAVGTLHIGNQKPVFAVDNAGLMARRHQIAEFQGTSKACGTAHGNDAVARLHTLGAAQIRDFYHFHGALVHRCQIHAHNSHIGYPVIILQDRILTFSIHKSDLKLACVLHRLVRRQNQKLHAVIAHQKTADLPTTLIGLVEPVGVAAGCRHGH